MRLWQSQTGCGSSASFDGRRALCYCETASPRRHRELPCPPRPRCSAERQARPETSGQVGALLARCQESVATSLTDESGSDGDPACGERVVVGALCTTSGRIPWIY